MKSIHLTIIVPVYNEEESLIRFREVMEEYFEQTPVGSEVLFVNDGSSDNSLDIIRSIALQDTRFKYISLQQNKGLSAAIKAGIDHANTPYIGYIDSDLQTTPLDFINYFPHVDQYAMINGIRANRNDSIIKKMSSKIANRFRRWMIKDGVRDTCCPLKIMHAGHAKRLPFFKGMHRFIPALIQLQGGKVKEVEIQHFKRYAGTAKYNLFNRMIGPFIDTLVFVWMRKRNITYQISETSIKTDTPLNTEHFE